jgi:TonB family protein
MMMKPFVPPVLCGLAVAMLAASPVRAQDSVATHPADSAHARTADAYELRDVDEMPELRNRSDVARVLTRVYPPEMKQRHETGTVALRMMVLRDGRVDSASVVVAVHSREGFDDAAATVVRTMRFSPARVNGEPVAVWVTLPVTFQMETTQAPPPRNPPPTGTVPRPVPASPPLP